MVTYVAFLRGINVGGKTIKMADLVTVFKRCSFFNVTTVLASGNVVFDFTKTDLSTLGKRIEKEIKSQLGLDVSVIVRSFESLLKIVAKKPFAKVKVTSETRCYVTFLGDKNDSAISVPYVFPAKDYKIIKVSNSVVYSVLTVSADRGTVDAMKFLEQTYGKNITTRNWNTLEKILRTKQVDLAAVH